MNDKFLLSHNSLSDKMRGYLQDVLVESIAPAFSTLPPSVAVVCHGCMDLGTPLRGVQRSGVFNIFYLQKK